MFRLRTAAVIGATLLLSASISRAGDAPSVRLPTEVHGEPGEFVLVKAELAGGAKTVRWHSPDRCLKLFPSDLLKNSLTAVVHTGKPGKYKLIAWTAAGDEPSDAAVCTVVIEGDGPDPPKPPAPPGPTPPPVPPDPLAAELLRLYQGDQNPQKAEHLKALVSLYQQAARMTDDVGIETVGDLLRVVRSAAANLMPADALPALRRRLADHLNTALELDPAAKLTADRRAFAAALFLSVAKKLESLK